MQQQQKLLTETNNIRQQQRDIDLMQQENHKIQSLSTYLWDKAIANQYIETALNTKFVQQLKHGTLHPQIYGCFMMQDYEYQQQAAILFQMASQQCGDADNDNSVKQLIQPFKNKYRKRADSHFKKWRIKKNMTMLSQACQAYVKMGRSGLQLYGSAYVFILQYACRRLWPDLANIIKDHVPIQTNAYKFWIQRYQCDIPQSKMSMIIDKLYKQGILDKQLSWKILEQCLICDINLLKQPFQQQFLEFQYFQLQNCSLSKSTITLSEDQQPVDKQLEASI